MTGLEKYSNFMEYLGTNLEIACYYLTTLRKDLVHAPSRTCNKKRSTFSLANVRLTLTFPVVIVSGWCPCQGKMPAMKKRKNQHV